MLEHLREFAVSERQREVLEVVIKEGSNNKASIALGIGRRVVDKIINRIKNMQSYKAFHLSMI